MIQTKPRISLRTETRGKVCIFYGTWPHVGTRGRSSHQRSEGLAGYNRWSSLLQSLKGMRIDPESCPKGRARPASDGRALRSPAAPSWTRPRSATSEEEGPAPAPPPVAEGALRRARRMLKPICHYTCSHCSCNTISRSFSTPETAR